jgi:hypothetical protein
MWSLQMDIGGDMGSGFNEYEAEKLSIGEKK